MWVGRLGEVTVVKVAVAKVDRKKGKRRRALVAKWRVRDVDGGFKQQFWIDANSATLDEDLTHVFKLNVAQARRENAKKFGSPDGSRKDVEKLKLSGVTDAIPKK